MALTAQKRYFGLNPTQIECGFAAFATTDTSVEIDTGKSLIYGIIITPIGASPVAYTLNEASLLSDGGVIARPTNGKLTITRAAGGPSGGAFSYLIIGD